MAGFLACLSSAAYLCGMEREEIKARREAAGMSQAALAGRLHTSRQYVHQLESGSAKTSASAERLAVIEAILVKGARAKQALADIWQK